MTDKQRRLAEADQQRRTEIEGENDEGGLKGTMNTAYGSFVRPILPDDPDDEMTPEKRIANDRAQRGDAPDL